MKENELNLSGIMLFVKDMKTVIAFYRDVIGLTPDEDQPVSRNTAFFALTPVIVRCVSIVRANPTKAGKN